MSAQREPGSAWTPEEIPDQAGRTAFITGGNSGIGFETARVLSSRGARVILAGRSAARLNDAADQLRRLRADAVVDTAVVDLGSLASIRDVSTKLAEAEAIDLLFNNAGVMNIPERRTTGDGFEMTFGTNHLGHFALTAGLLPALMRSPAARIVTVTAIAGTWRRGRLEDPMSERHYAAMGAYAKSKRANIVFTEELARRLHGTSVEAMVVHPGAAMTNLQRHTAGPLFRMVSGFMERYMMGTPEGAAWPSLYAATASGIVSGGFYGPAGRVQTSGTPKLVPFELADVDEGSRLWTLSEELTGRRFEIPARPQAAADTE